MEFSKIIYRAVVAGEGETAVTLFLCREMNAYILWRSAHDAELQYIASWFLFQRDAAIEKSVSIAAAECAKVAPRAKASPPKPAEKNRAALDKVKATSAAGNLLTIKLLSAKPQISSHKLREFLALSYCLVGKPRERRYASCWVDPLKPLLATSVGQDMLVKIETSTEGGKVYTNFVNAFKIGEREVKDFKFLDEAAAVGA